jgi:hypothetical protein
MEENKRFRWYMCDTFVASTCTYRVRSPIEPRHDCAPDGTLNTRKIAVLAVLELWARRAGVLTVCDYGT